MKLFSKSPLFQKAKKANATQDSQQTLCLSEEDLMTHGLFLNNVDMDADNKAFMKDILRLLKNPEPLLGGKLVNEFDFLTNYIPLYVLILIEDIESSFMWQLQKKNQSMAWGIGMERLTLAMTASDFLKQAKESVFNFLDVGVGSNLELSQLFCTLFSYVICHPDPFVSYERMERHRITFIMILHFNHEKYSADTVKRYSQTLGAIALYPKNCCFNASEACILKNIQLNPVQRKWVQLAQIMTREDIPKVSLQSFISDLRLLVNPMPQAIVQDLNACLDVMITTMKNTQTEEGRTWFRVSTSPEKKALLEAKGISKYLEEECRPDMFLIAHHIKRLMPAAQIVPEAVQKLLTAIIGVEFRMKRTVFECLRVLISLDPERARILLKLQDLGTLMNGAAPIFPEMWVRNLPVNESLPSETATMAERAEWLNHQHHWCNSFGLIICNASVLVN